MNLRAGTRYWALAMVVVLATVPPILAWIFDLLWPPVFSVRGLFYYLVVLATILWASSVYSYKLTFTEKGDFQEEQLFRGSRKLMIKEVKSVKNRRYWLFAASGAIGMTFGLVAASVSKKRIGPRLINDKYKLFPRYPVGSDEWDNFTFMLQQRFPKVPVDKSTLDINALEARTRMKSFFLNLLLMLAVLAWAVLLLY